MDLHRWFIPHRDTHQKAHLISWQAILVYILLFVFLQTSIKIFSLAKPGVLGTSSSITQDRIIELTNIERAKLGLPPVVENGALDQAAKNKATNMFEENYWAHFAPSGKSPWDFILNAGYRFVYAGENLAKNFTNSEDVITAWMNSSSHRENVVNPKYKDIGIAVEDGVLNGQKTTLVVQEFGSTSTQVVANAPKAKPSVTPQATSKVTIVPEQAFLTQPKIAVLPQTLPATITSQKTLLDPFQASKMVSISLLTLIMVLILVDFLVLKRRGVFRISSHHFAHMAILSLAIATIMGVKPGQIDQGLQFRAPDREFQISNFKFTMEK